MIGITVVAVAVGIGLGTWLVLWRHLRNLPAISARDPWRAAPMEVTLTAVLPEESDMIIVFRHAHRGADRRNARDAFVPAQTLVVERADDALIVEQLERWCTTAAPVILRQDRIGKQATFRDKASGVSIVLVTMS
jgi:hypothetical protein